MTAPDSALGGSEPETGVLQSCWLGPRPEDEVVKAGFSALSSALGSADLLEFPRRLEMMRHGFFERLLLGGITLQNCASADASAAETDVKMLSLEQLLRIRCLNSDFVPSGPQQSSKASFLSLVDRCVMEALADRFFPTETGTGSEFDGVSPSAERTSTRALTVRHTVLVYGVWHELKARGQSLNSDWWMLSVGGVKRFLNLPKCEFASSAPPGLAVCGYRSHTQADPRDPKRNRNFRWQVLLVERPETWKEDSLASELNQKQVSPKKDFFDDVFGGVETAITNAQTELRNDAAFTEKKQKQNEVIADVDDFFDSLLAEESATAQVVSNAGTVRESAPSSLECKNPATAQVVSNAGTVRESAPSPLECKNPSRKIGSPPRPCATEHVRTPSATNGVANETVEKASSSSAPAPSENSYISQRVSATDCAPDRVRNFSSEAKLQSALARFYHCRGAEEKLGNVEKIAQRYAGDGVVELWVALATKYAITSPTAIAWLANTLDLRTAVQWSRNQVPPAAQEALDAVSTSFVERVAAAGAEQRSAAEPVNSLQLLSEACSAVLEPALESENIVAASAVVFRHGCHGTRLRPRSWRAFLGLGAIESDSRRRQRDAYRELRQRLNAESNPEEPNGAKQNAAPVQRIQQLRADVETEVKSVWRGETFMARPGVVDAISEITLTHAWRCDNFIRGSCEMAAMLVYGLFNSDGPEDLADIVADAYWLLTALMAEMPDTISDDTASSSQVRRVHILLKIYDPPLAEMLAHHGLAALPTLRIATALFTRSGFTLESCARLWDVILTDPSRFEVVEYVTVALLLLIRGDLLQHSNIGSIAETILAAPKSVDIAKLLRTIHAVCAFERRCGDSSEKPFPPKRGACQSEAIEETMAVAQQHIASLWGRARTVGAEVWELSRTAAKETAAHVAAEAPGWRDQARTAVASAAAAAAAEAPGWRDQARNAVASTAAAAERARVAASVAMQEVGRTTADDSTSVADPCESKLDTEHSTPSESSSPPPQQVQRPLKPEQHATETTTNNHHQQTLSSAEAKSAPAQNAAARPTEQPITSAHVAPVQSTQIAAKELSAKGLRGSSLQSPMQRGAAEAHSVAFLSKTPAAPLLAKSKASPSDVVPPEAPPVPLLVSEVDVKAASTSQSDQPPALIEVPANPPMLVALPQAM